MNISPGFNLMFSSAMLSLIVHSKQYHPVHDHGPYPELELAIDLFKEVKALFENRIKDILHIGSLSGNEDAGYSDIEVTAAL